MVARRFAVGAATIAVLASLAVAAQAADGGVVLSPAEGLSGRAIELTTPLDGDGTSCEILWGDAVVQPQGSCGDNGVPVTLTASGAPGTYAVTVCDSVCDDPRAWRGAADFVVDAVVPDLSGEPLDEADAALAKAGLGSGSPDITGPPATALVTGSLPSADAVVPPSAVVGLLMSTPPAVLGGGDDSGAVQSSTVVRESTVVTSSSLSRSTPATSPHTSPHTSPVSAPVVAHHRPSRGWLVVALLLVGIPVGWAVRRAGRRGARHRGPAPSPRPVVTVGTPRTEVHLDRTAPATTTTADVRTRSASTTSITFGDHDDH